MPDVFITIEEAAAFEGIKYNTLIQRMKRTPSNTKRRPRPGRAEAKIKS